MRSIQNPLPVATRALISTLLITIMIAGCSTNASQVADEEYPRVYQRLSENFEKEARPGLAGGISSGEARLRLGKFIALFENIKRDDVAEQVRLVYAPSIYFNDTLKTLYDSEALAAYLEETAERVEYNRVDIHQVLSDGDNHFLRWSMNTGFRLLGKTVETRSIGMTQIRLDANGQVTFHQDFWDNTEGLFRHLPVLGFLINRTKRRF